MAENSAKSTMRGVMRIPAEAKVGLVLFEAQTEASFRLYLGELLKHYSILFVLPIDNISKRVLRATSPINDSVRQIDSLVIEPACDEMISFRVIDGWMTDRKIPVRVIDPNNRWLSRELSQ